jgi:hypothetical protein
MAVVRINFEDTYDLITSEPDLSGATFNSVDVNNNLVLINIRIEPINYPLLPGVYNLSFGPANQDGTVNDTIKIKHQYLDKVFSTILLFALTFLKNNPKIMIGIDGSNDVRAYMYHRMFLTNREYLKEKFAALGVDWFVRLLRNNELETNAQGKPFFKPRPEQFDYQRNAKDLYRFYMFKLSNTDK